MRRRVLILAFAAAAACRALPSAVPLADTGGALASPGANGRDRRSSSLSERSGAGGPADEIEVVADSKLPPPVAASDAGVVEAGGEPAEDAGATVAWPGEYYGSDRFVRRYPSRPDEVQVDDKAHTRVEQPSASSLLISVVNSLTGDVICALKAGVHGVEATLERGQKCFAEEEMEAEVTSGRATLAGDLLTLDFEGEVEADDEEESAKDSYHFEGRRR